VFVVETDDWIDELLESVLVAVSARKFKSCAILFDKLTTERLLIIGGKDEP
jgi:hypothetical protein